ncbi:acyltransferase [Parabacteroides faecis]|uniref:acyltransferase n=1 Tax=Parabacteroides faecis TaxID=1217282 RepID=UPI0021645018|nr:acyltransferase [Parabacteroides faecis]MCS2893474.1 acyltransferase [Parabacteroides faecis]UVQ47928.1 acyltransferase [Parabacteroides faecis]
MRISKSIYRILSKLKEYKSRKRVQFVCNSRHPQMNVLAYGEGNEIHIGDQSHTMDSICKFYGTNCKLIIGNNCIIKDVTFWFEGEGGLIEIGSNVTIEEAQIACVDDKHITIGNDCMFSRGISMVTTDSHSILDSEGNRINSDASIELASHIWVGANVRILKGVTIGENVVIGAESLVVKSIPAHCVVAGIPAKVLKSGTNWTRTRL